MNFVKRVARLCGGFCFQPVMDHVALHGRECRRLRAMTRVSKLAEGRRDNDHSRYAGPHGHVACTRFRCSFLRSEQKSRSFAYVLRSAKGRFDNWTLVQCPPSGIPAAGDRFAYGLQKHVGIERLAQIGGSARDEAAFA